MKFEGLPVRDAHASHIIDITASDVRRAESSAPDACAAALACKREFHSDDVRVHVSRTYVRVKDHWVRYMTPASLSREIVALDRGGRFQPGEYALTAPYPSSELGVKRSPKRKPKVYRAAHTTENIRERAKRA